MSSPFLNIDVNSEFFTPQEFPVEILEVAKGLDIIPCCLNSNAKQFLAFMLFKEYYFLHNGISVFVQDSIKALGTLADVTAEFVGPPQCHLPLELLSNIPTIRLYDFEDDPETEHLRLKEHQLLKNMPVPCTIICSRRRFLSLSTGDEGKEYGWPLDKLALVVCDDIHEALRDEGVKSQFMNILNFIRRKNESRKDAPIRCIFLTVSLLHFYGNESDGFWRMRETFKKLEKLCGAKVDTSSDVVALLRYCSPAKETVIPLNPTFLTEIPLKLTQELLITVSGLKRFLSTHQFDPIAAFGYDPNVPAVEASDSQDKLEVVEVEQDADAGGDTDSIAEELKKIGNPTAEPLHVIAQFENILEKFGPWCAERSLLLLIRLVDRLKVRTPYERHYLLLGALHTRIMLLQAAFHKAFKNMDPLEVLEIYATPKLRAILEILRRFDLSHPLELVKPRHPIAIDDDEEEDKDELDEDNADIKTVSPQKSGRERRRKNQRWDPARRGRNKHKKKIAELTAQTEAIKITTEENEAAIVPNGVQKDKLQDNLNETLNELGEIVEAGTELEGDINNTPEEENPRVKIKRYNRKPKLTNKQQEAALCGIVFVEDRLDARIIFHYLKEAAILDPKLIGLNPTLAINSNPEYSKDSRESEMEHKKREDNVRKFRYREANLLIGTSIVEDGIELPKSNLVIRYDTPKTFRSYLFSKGRAQAYDAEYFVFAEEQNLAYCLKKLATYRLVQEILLENSVIPCPKTCSSDSSSARKWDSIFPQFRNATLSTAIAIVNRYCARLPSDTFTRLVPLWSMTIETAENDGNLYYCTLRLPINSPVKWPIKGIGMPTEGLAKHSVALQTVMVLHANGELDDALLPIGKEGVIQEPDICVVNDQEEEDCGEFRPGSTKRRQYYDKRLATQFINCHPKPNGPFFLYWLRMVLTCPLPEEQNTRGRKLHPPELCSQSFGILMGKEIELVPSFPIYTRCGEVHVDLVRVMEVDVNKFTENLEKFATFHHYTFTSVLRLDKYLTLFDPELSENSYYVVPIIATEFKRNPEGLIVDVSTSPPTVSIDWSFLNVIWDTRNCIKPVPLSDEDRKDYIFRKEDYEDAVVMPWYRSHDVPQYFYVAEICSQLTPRSQFPGCEFKTFDEYYQKKYSINIQCVDQPLLDVDHTSARLNFLTPRYVNRKGMALPTSSESTKKAKRENLEQKQILVPELCTIHPFTASLWRQAVCLPCILYRLNSLLLSNNIRQSVACDIKGLGVNVLPIGFNWEPLSFGWSLSDVISYSTSISQDDGMINSAANLEDANKIVPDKETKDHEKNVNIDTNEKKCQSTETVDAIKDKKKSKGKMEDDKSKKTKAKGGDVEEELSGFAKAAKEPLSANVSLAEALLMNEKHLGKSANEILSEEMKKCKQPSLEIGMWSNDMAADVEPPENEFEEEEDELLDPTVAFPSNLMMLDKNWSWGGRSRLFNHRVHRALYGSPTHWGEVWDNDAFIPVEDLEDPKGHGGDNDAASVTSDMSGSDASFLDEDNSLKIQFHSGNTAEALDKRKFGIEHRQEDNWAANEDLWWQMDLDEECEKENDEEIAHYMTKREEALRKEFESEVEVKMQDISNIVPWENINMIPERVPRNTITELTHSDGTDKTYTSQFYETTQLKPPQSFPVTKSYIKKRSKVESTDTTVGEFSFDCQPNLSNHVGPSPCQILQALTMSNANDGLNLERLETIGDSFLKYAITSYLFCMYENIHEGKLSHLRSKQVSNVHLYRLGRRRGLGKFMVAAKFEPHDNWLPPGYHIPKHLDKALIHSNLPPSHVSMAQVTALKGMSATEMEIALKNHSIKPESEFIPYNLVTQQSIPDKSIADCVEALIGAYLTSMGSHGALLFMSWLGMRVLPSTTLTAQDFNDSNLKKNAKFYMEMPGDNGFIIFEHLKPPKSPLLRYTPHCEEQLTVLLKGYSDFEDCIGYHFQDKSYLLQAFTHASYSLNTLTDCYQRLEFLGDAILDYLITRHLYEDPRQHSPGSLTDLRSALVNNTIFASLAVKNNFHKYFRHSSPGLAIVLQKFVTFQEQHGNTLTQDYYLMDEEECEEAEDIEVPKALGDVFESVAGAIFLDSEMSLDAVWNVYYRIMKNEIEAFSKNVPKSPIRELLELEPETAKFGKPEKLWDGRRVRVTVEIFGVGIFRGIGRNYRIAKCTAAKCALRHVRKIRQNQARRHQ